MVAGGQSGYKFRVLNQATTTNAIVIRHNGFVSSPYFNVTTDFYRNGTLLHNYLYNNNGRNHEAYTDFNSPTEFGYNYIQGSTNGPAVNGAGQYYCWSIGLGANYAYGSYQAQFAFEMLDLPIYVLGIEKMEVGVDGTK